MIVKPQTSRRFSIVPPQYSAEVSQLAERAKCLVRDLDPTNELTFVRIASKKHEVWAVAEVL